MVKFNKLEWIESALPLQNFVRIAQGIYPLRTNLYEKFEVLTTIYRANLVHICLLHALKCQCYGFHSNFYFLKHLEVSSSCSYIQAKF